jgi:hypothetical protein
LKEEKLKEDHWCDRVATRHAVRVAIRVFLWDDLTGLPGEGLQNPMWRQGPTMCFVTYIGRIRPSCCRTSTSFPSPKTNPMGIL